VKPSDPPAAAGTDDAEPAAAPAPPQATPVPGAGDTVAPVRRFVRTAGPAAGAVLVAVLVALLGAGIAARGTGELRIPGAGITTALRVVVFAALAVHLGELAGARLIRTAAPRPGVAPGPVGAVQPGREPAVVLPPGQVPTATGRPLLAFTGPVPRGWSVAAALAGSVASAGQIVVLASVSGLDITAVYGTEEGRLLLVMANGFLLAAGCATLSRPLLALVPLAAVVGAEALRAHPEPYSPLLGAGLTVVHLTAASLWTGGLLHVLRAMWLRRADPAGGRALLARYARFAGWLFGALAATGTASALRRLPVDVVFSTAYGRVLTVKLLLLLVVAALALAARRRMRRAGDATPPARAELAALALVVLLSAILTVVPDPHWLSTR
jgi:putative copper export protein